MANDVRNEFTVFGSSAGERLELAVEALIKQLKTEDLKEVLWGKLPSPQSFDGRTRITDEYGLDFAFRSAWGSCDDVQDQICLMLSEIDPKVIVVNAIEEEFFKPIACRIVTISNEIEIFYNEIDITDQIHELDDRISDLEADEVGEKALALLEKERDELIEKAHEEVSVKTWQDLYKRIPSLKHVSD